MPRIAVQQCTTLLFLATMCLVMSPLRRTYATEPSSPKYDLQTETKIKGIVQDIAIPAHGHEKEVLHLVVKIGNDVIDVYLCPKSFLDEMGVEFNKGDDISVTGSKVKQGDSDLLLARQAQKGNDTLILRDDKGNPVWTWRSKR
jgi:hypothetical protein